MVRPDTFSPQSGTKESSKDLTGKGKEVVRGEIAPFNRRDEIYSTYSTTSLL